MHYEPELLVCEEPWCTDHALESVDRGVSRRWRLEAHGEHTEDFILVGRQRDTSLFREDLGVLRGRLSRGLNQVSQQSERRSPVGQLVRVQEELDEVRDGPCEGESGNRC